MPINALEGGGKERGCTGSETVKTLVLSRLRRQSQGRISTARYLPFLNARSSDGWRCLVPPLKLRDESRVVLLFGEKAVIVRPYVNNSSNWYSVALQTPSDKGISVNGLIARNYKKYHWTM